MSISRRSFLNYAAAFAVDTVVPQAAAQEGRYKFPIFAGQGYNRGVAEEIKTALERQWGDGTVRCDQCAVLGAHGDLFEIAAVTFLIHTREHF